MAFASAHDGACFLMSQLAKFQTVRVGQLCGTSIFYIWSTVFLTIVTFFSLIQKQARSQRSLEMLLGVVEENRKKEVMENLGVCAKLVEKIKTELAGLEGIYYDTVKCMTVI